MAHLEHELHLWRSGYQYIAGLDEVGRGPVAGPVTVAAVILPQGFHCDLVDDSKRLSVKEREYCYDLIVEQAVAFSVVHGSVAMIEKINILNAVKRCMIQALRKLPIPPDFLLIDALNINYPGIPQLGIIGGDAISKSIAAASIIAKVTRDRLMLDLDRKYPGYDLAKHKGYATPTHIRALKLLGPAACHRPSFLGFLAS